MINKFSKEELEKLIAKEWTLGTYIFDEEKQCFFGDAEIEFGFDEIEENTYQNNETYFFDGYECPTDDEEMALIFKGSQEEIKTRELLRYKDECSLFNGYPIYYNNVTITFAMLNGTYISFLPNGEVSIQS